MKKCTETAISTAKFSDLEISNFLHTTRSVAHKVPLQLKGCYSNFSQCSNSALEVLSSKGHYMPSYIFPHGKSFS